MEKIGFINEFYNESDKAIFSNNDNTIMILINFSNHFKLLMTFFNFSFSYLTPS